MEEAYPLFSKHIAFKYVPILPELHRKRFEASHAKRYAEKVRELKLDLVHFTAPLDLNVPPIPDCGTKSVYTFYDAIPIIFPERYFDRLPGFLKALYEKQKQAMLGSNRIVAISEASKRDLIKLMGADPHKVSRVFATLQKEDSNPPDADELARVQRKFFLTPRYFAFCSVADWHKGVDSLISALAIARQTLAEPVQLAFIGPQHKEAHAYVRELCFDAGLHGRDVVVTGYIEDEELSLLFKGAIALVSPSRYEGFGYPAAQALALGVPVIASDRSSLPEVVGTAGILIEPEDPAAIANAMVNLATDEPLRQELILKGLVQAKEFDSVKIAREIHAIYREVISTS
jgi:glycosyltransferase involved in cell wall biosynthesis